MKRCGESSAFYLHRMQAGSKQQTLHTFLTRGVVNPDSVILLSPVGGFEAIIEMAAVPLRKNEGLIVAPRPRSAGNGVWKADP